ncbi:hypothetical protein [Streptomyces zagrosensis]|uniref:Uncharacterized protein n=1 Tax=Streptomyces zagrosensis TaxID=1042984 RepID=A0A7W9V2U5_9ACTN|nr:hypothetical protein [Streptomyces zagrosensis]MBB5939646.1 hypothetical protein [Streptomyces zagrosensis]
MTKLMLSIHVLVAVMFIGPVTVAASLFPRFARQALTPVGALATAHNATDADLGAAAHTAAASESSAVDGGAQETALAARPADPVAASAAGGAGGITSVESTRSVASVMLLHRISRVYALLSVVVPAFGLLTAQQMGVIGDAWLIASMVLTAIAAVLLGIAVLGYQDSVVTLLEDEDREVGAMRAMAARLPKLSMVTGMFALTWAVVVVLMIVRPGSTTGA